MESMHDRFDGTGGLALVQHIDGQSRDVGHHRNTGLDAYVALNLASPGQFRQHATQAGRDVLA
jgi:hypothetical protein